jgi:hypothetical protein
MFFTIQHVVAALNVREPDAEKSDAPLVMVSIYNSKMKLADKTVYPYGRIDTNFNPHRFSLVSRN